MCVSSQSKNALYHFQNIVSPCHISYILFCYKYFEKRACWHVTHNSFAECIYTLHTFEYTATPDMTHVIHSSSTRSLQIITDTERCLCACSIKSVNNWKTLPATSDFKQIKKKIHLNLQHCNFMIINFVHFRMLL